MKNLTPHPITIFSEDLQHSVTIPPSGVVARVECEEQEEICHILFHPGLPPVPVVEVIHRHVSGIDFMDECAMLVSENVFMANEVQGFVNVYTPDTASAVVDDDNQIIGFTRLKSTCLRDAPF